MARPRQKERSVALLGSTQGQVSFKTGTPSGHNQVLDGMRQQPQSSVFQGWVRLRYGDLYLDSVRCQELIQFSLRRKPHV